MRFDSEQTLVRSFLSQMFRLFPKMSFGAFEVAGPDGGAGIWLGQTRAVNDYAKTHVAQVTCDDAGCKIHRLHASPAPPRRGLFSDIVAIEVKLKDWNSGLYQARRYRQFAHRSYVLVANGTLENALRQSARFRRAGIGSIGFRNDFK